MVDPYESDISVACWTIGAAERGAGTVTSEVVGFACANGMEANGAHRLGAAVAVLLDGAAAGVSVDAATDGEHLSVRIAWPAGATAGATAMAVCPPGGGLGGRGRAMLIELPIAPVDEAAQAS